MDKEQINKKVDILVFGAHPDDIELACSGTILKHLELGYNIGLIDLTQGELGTRGNKEIRQLGKNVKIKLKVKILENWEKQLL